jgi:DNA damage-binding protein 1
MTLTYLTSQIIYLGSHLGPSHLLRLSAAPTSLLSEPTLPIPDGIKTIEPNQLFFVSKGKEKDGNNDGNVNDTRLGWILATKGRYFQEVETWKNLAPILDGICVDTDGSGQTVRDLLPFSVRHN